MAGSSGYDLVFPTARPFADRHIKAGIYQPVDKSKLLGLERLDPKIFGSLQDLDPVLLCSAPWPPMRWCASGDSAAGEPSSCY